MKRVLLVIVVAGLGGWPLWAQLSVTNGSAALNLSTQAAFGNAYQFVAYGKCVAAQNGAPPYTFSILSGSLPTGITQTGTTGCFAGTPTGTGTSSFTVKVVDSKGATQTLPTGITVATLSSLTVTPTGQTIATGTTLQMIVTPVWSDSCTATCPAMGALVTWAPATFGTAGSISASGLLTAGSAATTPSVTAAFHGVTSGGVTVTITTTSPNVVLTTGSLPNGQINQAYPESVGNNQLGCSGGAGPYTFALASGSLPTGLSLSSAGLITGTATAAGTSTPAFNCTATVGGTSANKTLNIVVASLASIAALAPAAPTVAQFGQQQFVATCNYSDSSSAICQAATGSATINAFGCGSAANNATLVATLATTTPCSVAIGNTLVIAYHSDNAVTPTYTVPTDTAGNTAVAATPQQCQGGTSDRCDRVYYMPITTANASDIVTAHYGVSTFPVVVTVTKLTGASASPLDQNGNSFDGGTLGNQATSASITPTVANTMAVFATMSNGNARTFSAVPGSTCVMQVTDPAGFVGMEACPILGTSAITQQMNISGAATAWNAAISNYKPAVAGGVVWTATDASGINVASINLTGLATANNAGTSNIKACIGATCSANNLMTVTAAADTSLTVQCPNLNVGSNGQCSAKGVPSGVDDTNSAMWASSNASVVSSTGAGAIHGVANGSATMTATLGSINGVSVPITVSTVASNGPLSGCTVNATNSVTGCANTFPPSGYTLVMADGAENGPQAGEDLTHVSLCTAGNSTSLGTIIPAHTLSHSYCGAYQGDGQDVHVGIPIPTGSTAVDISFWDRVDPQGMYGNSDYIPMHLYSNSYALGLQAQYFNNNASTLTTTFYPHSYSPNESFWYSGPSYNSTIDAGVWVQYEALIIPDTMNASGSLTGNGVPPYPCNSPAQSGCGNGTLKFWVNGALVIDCENCNLINTHAILSDNAQVHIGDYITSFGINSGPRCTTFSLTGGGTCPGTQPGSGGPKPFFRYLDDIIVVRQ